MAFLAACCPAGSWPASTAPTEYLPKGTEDMIDDLPVYYVGTPCKKAVIVLPEVFGWAGHLKSICDTLASEGFFVIMPDCHRKDTAEGKADLLAWVALYPYDTVVGPDMERLMRWLAEKGATDVGALGFCWGAWALCKASAAGVPLKCGVGPHPSIKLEEFAFKGDQLSLATKVQMPVLLLPAGNDPPNVKEGGQVAAALAAKGGGTREYPEMLHGWVSRGDTSQHSVARDAEDALKTAISFLNTHLTEDEVCAVAVPCCPIGSWPALVAPAEYTPKGTEDMIDDLPVYCVGTPCKKAVIVLPEVFGWAGRLKGICDTLASEGFFVVMPDCHRKDTAEGKADLLAWVALYPYDAVVGPDMERLMRWLAEKGATDVGALGFCWGAWALCKASAAGVPLKCGVGPHPSIKLEEFAFKGDQLSLATKVQMPVLLLPAGNDPPNVKEGGQVAGALAAKGGSTYDYPRMAHGWVSRGDLSQACTAADTEDALKRTIAFLQLHM